MNKSLRSGLASKMILAVIVVVAAAVTVSAQVRRRVLTPQTTQQVKIVPGLINQGPADSAQDTTGPGPANPYFGQRFEPLVIRVAEQPTHGMPIMVSVSKPSGEPFTNFDDNSVELYSPFYHQIKRTPGAGQFLFDYGNARVKSQAYANVKGSVLLLGLQLHRNDPDIPPAANTDRRPFLLIVQAKERATGIVFRGEAMVTLDGYVSTP